LLLVILYPLFDMCSHLAVESCPCASCSLSVQHAFHESLCCTARHHTLWNHISGWFSMSQYEWYRPIIPALVTENKRKTGIRIKVWFRELSVFTTETFWDNLKELCHQATNFVVTLTFQVSGFIQIALNLSKFNGTRLHFCKSRRDWRLHSKGKTENVCVSSAVHSTTFFTMLLVTLKVSWFYWTVGIS
jgi:hypothetical protein